MGIPIITVIVSLMIVGVDVFISQPVTILLGCGAHVLCYWLIIRYILIQYHKRYRDYKFNANRIFYILSRISICYIVVKLILGFFMAKWFPECHELFIKNEVSEYISPAIMIAMMFFVYEGIYYLNKSRNIEIEKNLLQKITAQHQLNTLRNQVNPHFLFNSLNTLVSIIPEEPNMAIKFVQEMSRTYRNILEVRDEKLITIEQELKALESYIYLLKTRFTGKVHILNAIDASEKNHFILPLSLQILIENAVKHNITSKKNPLKIELLNKDNYIIVKNNLQRKDQQYSSTKLGLKNIESRYSLLAEKNIIIEETETEFIVKLPIIQNNEDTNH